MANPDNSEMIEAQSAEKKEFIRKSIEFWNPGKTQFWQDVGVDLVIDRRQDYFLYDMDGRRLIDVHLNGGTYNIGHRHPELVEVLNRGTQRFDMGNHHFPALGRTALAEKLAKSCGGDLHYTIYGSGGGEAIDIAIKTARHAKQKKKIVSIVKAYHGHTGLAVATGSERFSKLFLSDRPDEFFSVPFNDLNAMEDALKGKDVAAVIMETIPATYGFPMPLPGYLTEVKKLTERYDALYIADEVQTGMMRTGEMWGYQRYGIQPDIVVIGKGISGGMYPIACVVVREPYAGWLKQDGFGHISTMGGAELGCLVALKTLEILERPQIKPMVNYISELMASGLSRDHEALFRLLRRHPAMRRRDGPGVRLPRRRQAGDEASLRERRVGDLLHPRCPRAAVQARRADDRVLVRGAAGARGALHRPRPRRVQGTRKAPLRRMRTAR